MQLYTTDFAEIGAWRVSNNQVPAAQMMVFPILRVELGTTLQQGGDIAADMPFGVPTSAAFLYVAGVGLMP